MITVNVEAIAAYAQKCAQENFSSEQKSAGSAVGEIRDAKNAARKEMKDLEEREKHLRSEDEDSWCDFGFFGRTQSDVNEDIANNGLQQQKVSVTLKETQKGMADVQKDVKDVQEEYSEQQQGFKEMLQILDDMKSATTKIG